MNRIARFLRRIIVGATATAAGALSVFASGAAGPGVRLCSVGYLTDVPKVATVAGAETATTFSVVDTGSGAIVHSGKLGPLIDSPPTGERVREADFGALRRRGTYVVRVAGLPDSAPFTIAPDALNRSLECVMLGFYGQRCGQAVRFQWNGDTFVHAACHLDDAWLDYNDPAKAGQRKDGTGGWHDAGDYGKYAVNAAFASAMMLLAWERHAAALKQLQSPMIPEHGGPLPDFLAELKYNLDWLLEMQMGDGQVAHKLTALTFGPMILPEADRQKRYFSPNSRLATLDFAAVGCMAADVFRAYNVAYADIWAAAAKRAWVAARTMPDANPDTSAFHSGAYFAPTGSDYKWALIEVRLALGEDFLTADERAAFAGAIDSDDRMFSVVWDWGNGYNLGLYSWLFSAEARRHPQALATLRQDLLDAADVTVRTSGQHAYGRGVKVNYWGVNGAVARTVMNLDAAFAISGDRRYRDTAYAQIAYLYGRNPFGRSFVTGDGFHPPMFPHHRPSVGDSVKDPWPGHLVGGPHPTETDWFDETASYRTNEVAINWDAALAYALAVFYRP